MFPYSMLPSSILHYHLCTQASEFHQKLILHSFTTEHFTYLDISKFYYGGLVLGASQFSLLHQPSQKNEAQFQGGQNWFKNNHLALLIWICDTLCRCKAGRKKLVFFSLIEDCPIHTLAYVCACLRLMHSYLF